MGRGGKGKARVNVKEQSEDRKTMRKEVGEEKRRWEKGGQMYNGK